MSIFMRRVFSLILLITVISFVGCQKAEQPKQEQPKQEQAAPQTAAKADTVKKPVLPDVKGTWKGTFDNRPAELKISEQTENSFKGTIVVKFRDEYKSKVSGSFNAEKMTFEMKDLDITRSANTYTGTFDKEFHKLNGTATQNVEKIKAKFSFTK